MKRWIIALCMLSLTGCDTLSSDGAYLARYEIDCSNGLAGSVQSDVRGLAAKLSAQLSSPVQLQELSVGIGTNSMDIGFVPEQSAYLIYVSQRRGLEAQPETLEVEKTINSYIEMSGCVVSKFTEGHVPQTKL